MPAAPNREAFGAVVRRITGGLPVQCSMDCHSVAHWVVTEEQGNDDAEWYACDEDLAELAEGAIEGSRTDD